MRTRSPRRSSNMPIDALVSPFPKELTTPPVTKMCFVMGLAHHPGFRKSFVPKRFHVDTHSCWCRKDAIATCIALQSRAPIRRKSGQGKRSHLGRRSRSERRTQSIAIDLRFTTTSTILSLSRSADKRPIIFERIDPGRSFFHDSDGNLVACRQHPQLLEAFDRL